MKYYLKINATKYKQVTRKEYMKMERFCGFKSKFKTKLATTSFSLFDYASGMNIKGKVLK